MDQQVSELSTRLATLVEDWKQDVGKAQQALIAQFDTANRQLGRLLQVLAARQEQAVALAEAREELNRLRPTSSENDLPAGALTEYGTSLSPETEAMRRDLANLLEKLSATVRAWTAEVTQAQGNVNRRVERGANVLDTLLVAIHTPRTSGEEEGKLAHAVEALRSELSALREAEAKRVAEVETLHKGNADLKSNLEEAEAARNAAEERATGMEASIASASERIEEAEAEASLFQCQALEITAELDKATAERDRLRATVSEHEEVVTNLETQVADLIDTQRAAEAEVSADETHRSDMEQELAELHLKLEAVKTEARDAQDESARLGLELRDLRAALTEREAALEAARERADQLETRADGALEQGEALRDSREQLNTADAWIQELERQVAELSEVADAADPNAADRVKVLEGDLAERDARIAELEAHIDQIGENRTTSLAVIDTFLEELDDVETPDLVAQMDSGEEEDRGEEEEAPHAADTALLISHDGEAGRMRLGQVLMEAGAITEQELQVALLEKHQRPDILLGTLLLNHGYVTESGIAEGLAKQLGLNVVHPMERPIPPEIVAMGERGLCTWHVCIPLRIENEKLVTAMSNPLDEEALVRLGQRAKMEILPAVATASQILTAIEKNYGIF